MLILLTRVPDYVHFFHCLRAKVNLKCSKNGKLLSEQPFFSHNMKLGVSQINFFLQTAFDTKDSGLSQPIFVKGKKNKG